MKSMKKSKTINRRARAGFAAAPWLACRQFEEEDLNAIERVTMLLVEYAWSSDPMSDNAKKLKAAMLKVWAHWQARQAND